MNVIKTHNPFDNSLINEYETFSENKIIETISHSHAAFLDWKYQAISKRAQYVDKAAEVLIKRKDTLAKLITTEMGKPLAQSKAEVEKCSLVCHYYAENCEEFLRNLPIATEMRESFVTFKPLGVILSIMPWNFPLWQVFRFAIPTLCAGNTVILKHASNVSGCSLEIEEIFKQAGFPKDTFRSIIIPSTKIPSIIKSNLIQGVTLTGSTMAGKAVAAIAGESLKKTVLELGGSDPYLILKDADLEHAATACVKSRLLNAGQSCIAAKRFIADSSIYEIFKEKVKDKMKKVKLGDPMAIDTEMGPMARIDLRDNLDIQVQRSIAAGAKCILGGNISDGAGAFYPPTILENVTESVPAYYEELFGPVAVLIKAINEDDAIQIANKTSFGLGAGVFTRNLQHGKDIAENRLDAGTCFINDFVRSDPRIPFGGIKESGHGRELSDFGIKEFVNIKTVVVT